MLVHLTGITPQNAPIHAHRLSMDKLTAFTFVIQPIKLLKMGIRQLFIALTHSNYTLPVAETSASIWRTWKITAIFWKNLDSTRKNTLTSILIKNDDKVRWHHEACIQSLKVIQEYRLSVWATRIPGRGWHRAGSSKSANPASMFPSALISHFPSHADSSLIQITYQTCINWCSRHRLSWMADCCPYLAWTACGERTVVSVRPLSPTFKLLDMAWR